MGFFDRVKDTVSSAGTGMSQKVSYTTDTMKLNSQIRSNDKEIEKLIYQVGLKCVQLHLNDSDSEYEELFAQIRNLQVSNDAHRAEIQRLTEELEYQEQLRQQEMKNRQEQRERERREKEELKQQQAELAKEEELAKEQETQGEPDETTKVCAKCNQRSDLDSKFCVFCGTPFPTEDDSASREAEPASRE